jgi:hypothetical protein
MKLIRRVEWKEYSQEYEVEWWLDLEGEVLPKDFVVHLSTGHAIYRHEHTKEGDFYMAGTSYTEEKVADIEQDTVKIIEAVKSEIERARENRKRAKLLTAEFTFDVD